MKWIFAIVWLLGPSVAFADGLILDHARVPESPPGAQSHAAYLTVTNTDARTRSLIAVRAEGYKMAHLHQSKEENGIATMAPVDQLDIAAGATIEFEPGGLHIMLMMPEKPAIGGDEILLHLEFLDGEVVDTIAVVVSRASCG